MTRFLLEGSVLLALTLAAYLYYVRPHLKKLPTLAVLWKEEDSLFAAVKARFAGIKTFLAIGVAQALSAVVFINDDVLPYAIGVDWTPITWDVPPWVWPLVSLFWLWMIAKFRKFTDDRQEAQ